MNNNNKNNCIICGSEIVYFEKPRPVKCIYCNKDFESDTVCSKGHYVCDRCHSMPALDFIEKHCVSSSSENPIEMADYLMRDKRVKMHGPEHHFLIPAVLLSSYYNTVNKPELKTEKLHIARKRAAKVYGGNCGFLGNCGAAVGTGIYVSILTGATPLSYNEWSLSNLMTSKSLYSIAMSGGPRCCKRNTFLAITDAVTFTKNKFDVKLSSDEKVKCSYSNLNNECLKEKCKFYKIQQ